MDREYLVCVNLLLHKRRKALDTKVHDARKREKKERKREDLMGRDNSGQRIHAFPHDVSMTDHSPVRRSRISNAKVPERTTCTTY